MAEIRLLEDDARPPRPERRHLLSVADLTRDDLERLLATSRTFDRSREREVKKLPTLRGKLVINVFYESSTRTTTSFELAAKRLSADTLTMKSGGSSVEKGESLKDTALTLDAFDPDLIVIRHPQAGAPWLGALGRDTGAAAAGSVGDASRADEPRRRDRPARRRLGGVVDRRPGALGARRADGGALRPAHAGTGPGGRLRGGRLMLFAAGLPS